MANPTHGTRSGRGANRTYTPTASYVGSDSFTFTVNDGAASSSAATVSITVSPGAPVGTGTGLAATYYDNPDFTGATVQRTDATVDFAWGGGAPVAGIGADTFSVRWSGQVQAQHSQTYTFVATGDDGIRLRVNGQLLVDVNREASVNAPLPVIGVRGLWQLTHDFYIDASAQYFALSIDEYDGSVTDMKFNVTWQPKPWLGIGIGYNVFGVDVGVDTNRFDGNLDWSYSGPMFFYSASF